MTTVASVPSIEADPRARATHDALTGLLNREGLNEELERFITNYPGQFAVFFVDLNNVKKTNDTQGHAAGDELLVHASEVFDKTLQDEGIMARGRGKGARTGGDEFVLVFPGAQTKEQLQTIDTLLRKNLDTDGVSAAVGGQLHQAGLSAAEILSKADAAMYEDKRRQKIERYSPRQLEVIQQLGALSVEHEIDLRDVPIVLSTLPDQSQ